MKRYFYTFALAACLLPTWGMAQSSPEQVARQYVQAVKTHGIAAAPRYMHAKEQERFKAMLLPLLQTEDGLSLAATLFGASQTAVELSAMPAADFMEGIFKAIGRQMSAQQMSVGDTQIIGTVKEGEVAHVLTRISVGTGDLKITRMSVISMLPEGDSWKLMLSGQVEGLAQAFKAGLKKEQGQ